MRKLQLFDIILYNNPNAVYTSGQQIQGHVVVNLSEPMKMRGIELVFSGKANVHWSERHTTGTGKNRRTVTRHYSANEVYFDQHIVLFGKPCGQWSGENPFHPAGEHMYKFLFQLPQNLPSSFEGSVGRVRYCLKSTIDKPWKFDHHCKKTFTVLSVLDLNYQPDVLSPLQGQDEKTLCCCCCKSGPIAAVFRIDRRGYVPGEFIIVNGEVTNLSNRTMNYSKVIFRMTVVYHATSKSKTEVKDLTNIRKGSIASGGTEIWTGERIHIPPLPPSNLINCRIIDIHYQIILSVEPSGPAFDLNVPLPVCIGTIPLRNVVSTYATNGFGRPAHMPSAPPMDAIEPPPAYRASPMPSIPASNAPPPSYEECVLGKVDMHEEGENEHMMGNMNWAPSYSYYTWNQPPGATAFSPHQGM